MEYNKQAAFCKNHCTGKIRWFFAFYKMPWSRIGGMPCLFKWVCKEIFKNHLKEHPILKEGHFGWEACVQSQRLHSLTNLKKGTYLYLLSFQEFVSCFFFQPKVLISWLIGSTSTRKTTKPSPRETFPGEPFTQRTDWGHTKLSISGLGSRLCQKWWSY